MAASRHNATLKRGLVVHHGYGLNFIFILVIVVLGLAAAFIALKNALVTKTQGIEKCVSGAAGPDGTVCP